jgi:predicted ATP-grasp superfamily ATP-dependent carboligase
VLVLDASTRQALAATRSLGRAGLRVGLAECYADCPPGLPVLAFRSRYCSAGVVLPSFADEPRAYAEAVVELVRAHRPRVLIPGSDGSIAAILPYRDTVEDLGCALALPPEEALAVANSKDKTLALAAELGIEHPQTVIVTGATDLAHLRAGLSFPVVLKPATSWSPRSGERLQSLVTLDPDEADAVITRLLRSGSDVLVQEWAGGRREGVTLLVVGGEVVSSFGHLEHRTTPLLGGASVVRESIRTPQDILGPAVRLVTALGLEGLSEVEFRRNASGTPLLMEINARLAGSIETAVRAGADFPLLLWQWASGQPLSPPAAYREGLRLRWLRGDMRWLRENHRGAGRPDALGRWPALWIFMTEFVRTPRLDCFDRADMGPVLVELRTTISALTGARDMSPES